MFDCIRLTAGCTSIAVAVVLLDDSTLDVSYVSSVSWYFLVSFGMRGFLSLVLGEMSGMYRVMTGEYGTSKD